MRWLCASVAFALTLSSASVAGDKKDLGQPLQSQAANGTYLQLSTKSALKAGDLIPLEVTFVNGGKEESLLTYDRYQPFKLQLKVTYKDGKSVPLTAYGKKRLEPSKTADSSATTLSVASGEKGDLSVSNLALYFDMTLSGEYVITAERTVAFAGDPAPANVRLKTQLTIRVQGP